jgi:hypothetical protein
MQLKKVVSFGVIGVALMLSTTACGTHSISTAADQVALHYEGGPFSSKKYASYVPASTKKWFGPGDKEYAYPINQRIYDSTGDAGAESAPIISTSKDSVEMSTPISVTFVLKTDEQTLRAFHEKVGLRFQAYMRGDETTSGWDKMLAFYIGQTLETTLDREIANYTWRDLYNKPAIRVALQAAVNRDLPALIAAKIGGEYFDDFSAQVQKPDPTNQTLKDAIAANQNNIAAAQAAQAKARADLLTAQAQIALQRAEAAKKKADISAYGSVEEYNKAQCIAAGCNPYQPTYVVNGTTPGQTK